MIAEVNATRRGRGTASLKAGHAVQAHHGDLCACAAELATTVEGTLPSHPEDVVVIRYERPLSGPGCGKARGHRSDLSE